MRNLFFLWLLLPISIVLIACSQKDAHYYRQHPQALQQALQNCSPSSERCKELATIAQDLNKLAYKLQLNPLDFGKKILQLQEKLAAQKIALQRNPEQKQLAQDLAITQQQLQDHLTVVKWLESPHGS